MAGKSMGLKVKEFMFGLPGPRIFSFRWGETEYGATMIPFGGYVKFAGVESELQLEEDEEDKDTPPERKYDTQPRWKKALIMFAGPLMNMVFAVVIFALMFSIQGVAEGTTTLGNIVKNGPAEHAGLKKGDKVVSIDGNKVENWNDVVEQLHKRPGKQITVVVKRDGKTLVKSATLEKKNGQGVLGVWPSQEVQYKRLPLHTAIYRGTLDTIGLVKFMAVTIYNLIVHKPAVLAKEGTGPVGIVYASAKVFKQSFWEFMWLLAIITINIGIVNLLPIPPLDGGRLAILGLEGLVRGPLNKKAILAINAIGMALLLAVMVYFVFSDITKIIQGSLIPGGG